jgi:DNA-binding MarR family transcriptional regulator
VSTLVLLLARLGRLNEAFIAQFCREHGVGAAELQVLAVLCRMPGRTASPSAIARTIVQTSGGFTATLRRLERQGFIERCSDESDGRGRLVVVTEAGSEFHDAALDDLFARYATLLSGVDVEQALTAVRALITPLERAVQAAPSAGWVDPLDRAPQ